MKSPTNNVAMTVTPACKCYIMTVPLQYLIWLRSENQFYKKLHDGKGRIWRKATLLRVPDKFTRVTSAEFVGSLRFICVLAECGFTTWTRAYGPYKAGVSTYQSLNLVSP